MHDWSSRGLLGRRDLLRTSIIIPSLATIRTAVVFSLLADDIPIFCIRFSEVVFAWLNLFRDSWLCDGVRGWDGVLENAKLVDEMAE